MGDQEKGKEKWRRVKERNGRKGRGEEIVEGVREKWALKRRKAESR